jgi:glycosyltransferase involved in cell wall biosynthesis
MKHLVSICIPVYKQKAYLEKCLQSVLKQDFTDFELIISDDTPDDSLELFINEILKDRAYTYQRNQPALGNPANWNSAIAKSTGKYLKILHHDDFFTETYSLRLMVEEIEKQRASFLFCQTDVWYPKTNEHRIHSITPKQLAIIKQKPEFLFFKNVIGAPSVTLYLNDKSVLYDPAFKWLVDVDLYIEQLYHNRQIAFIDKPLVSTSHEIEGQVTGSVENNKEIQVREHVLLFNKIKDKIAPNKNFVSFFDYLLFKYRVLSFEELAAIVPEAKQNKEFFMHVINHLPEDRRLKTFKKRFFESRYNNYIFKLEQFL